MLQPTRGIVSLDGLWGSARSLMHEPFAQKYVRGVLCEARASPAYVMSQMGHRSASMALEVYAKRMARDRVTGARIDAILNGTVGAHSSVIPLEAAYPRVCMIQG